MKLLQKIDGKANYNFCIDNRYGMTDTLCLLGFNINDKWLANYVKYNQAVTIKTKKDSIRHNLYAKHFKSKYAFVNSYKAYFWEIKQARLTTSLNQRAIHFANASKIKENIYKYQKEGNVAVTQHKNSKVIALDIDTHDYETRFPMSYHQELYKLQEEFTDFLRDDFGYIPLMIERSKIGRGLRIYLKTDYAFNSIQNQKFRKLLKKHFDTYFKDQFHCNLEFRTDRKKLRLPMSSDYSTWRIDENYNFKRINTLKILYNYLQKDHDELNLDRINSYLETLYGKEKQQYFYKSTNEIRKTDFPMYRGDRINNHFLLAKKLQNEGKTLQDFKIESSKWNYGSKDLTNNFDKTCESMWKSSQKSKSHFYMSSPSGLVSNMSLVKGEYRKLYKHICYSLDGKLKHTNQSVLKKEMKEYFLKELVGSMSFQDSNPRQILHGIRLSQDRKDEMTVGYQFPIELLERIKSEYKLESNVKNVLKLFLSYLRQYKHTKQGYFEGCCRQWLYDFSIYKVYKFKDILRNREINYMGKGLRLRFHEIIIEYRLMMDG